MDKFQTKILSYKPKPEVNHLLKQTKVLLLVGPTGSGKNTLEQELLKTSRYRPIVTHTTRSPRINQGTPEKDGVEYHFISKEQAIKMLDDHKFVEAAYTHDNFYGTSIEEFRTAKKEDKIPVADIDVKGVRAYRQYSNQVIAIFLMPPSFKILIERLVARYGEQHDQADIKLRLATALDELSELNNTDYYHLIINDRIPETTAKVLDIVAGKLTTNADQRALKLASTLIDDIKAYLAT